MPTLLTVGHVNSGSSSAGEVTKTHTSIAARAPAHQVLALERSGRSQHYVFEGAPKKDCPEVGRHVCDSS